MTNFQWPNGRRAAVSLRFDDGLDSHLDVAIPMLDEYRLCGTFYVCPAGSEQEWIDRAARWRAPIESGHEVGNHTMSHPIPAALTDDPAAGCYERLTPQQYEADVLEAQRRLVRAFGPREWTFCYPCYQTSVGTGRERRSVVPFIAEHFVAACAGGEISKPFNPPDRCDLHALLGLRGDGMIGPELLRLVETAEEMGRWAIITFHGINQGHLCTRSNVFEALLHHLNRRRHQLWVAPVVDVARHIHRARRELQAV